MKEIVKWLPLVIISVIVFSVGIYFIVKLLRKTQVQKAEKGIKVFGLIAIILGGWNILFFGGIIALLTHLPLFEEFSQVEQMWVGVIVVFCIKIVLATLLFSAGIGVWKLRSWGRKAILIQSVLSLAYHTPMMILSIAIGAIGVTHTFVTSLNLFVIVFSLLVLWYFNRSSVKAQFEQPLQKSE